MAARDVFKNLNLFVDGRGYAGQVEDFTPPVVATVTESARLGGMVGPVELSMGMEAMRSSFSLIAFDADVLSLWGVTEGQTVNSTVRGLLESFDGTKKPIVYAMRGKVVKLDQGTIKPGEKASLKAEFALSYFRQEVNGVTVQEIDVENMVHIVAGVDRLAADRAALGI